MTSELHITTVNNNPKQPKVCPDTKSDNTKNNCPCESSIKNAYYIDCVECAQEWHLLCVNLDGLTPTAISKIKSWKCPYCYRCPFFKHKNGDEMTTTLETLFEGLQSFKKCNDTEFKNLEIIKKSVDNKENKDITKWTRAIKKD